jgi:hypothetical protein
MQENRGCPAMEEEDKKNITNMSGDAPAFCEIC